MFKNVQNIAYIISVLCHIHQNRMGQHRMKIVCLLKQRGRCCMPLTCQRNLGWDGMTAAYIINRTGPTSIEVTSLCEIWFGRSTTITRFNIFGTECFLHVPKEKGKKFDKFSCRLLWWQKWLLSLDTRIFWTRDVVFKEEQTTSAIFECTNTTRFSVEQISNRKDNVVESHELVECTEPDNEKSC